MGVVYLPSPVRASSHAEPHAAIVGWLVTYCASTPGVWADDNATVRLDLDNEPQPDALLRIDPAAGGRSRLSADDYIEGGPELIVEVATSSAAIDLHDKLGSYRRNGVREYVVWRVLDRQIDWFVLSDGEYRPLTADSVKMIESACFPDSAWPLMRCCRETWRGCSPNCRTACALLDMRHSSKAWRQDDMPALESDTIIPTAQEDAIINAGIAADPDTPELADEWFGRAWPASKVVPHIVERSRRVRAKQKGPTKATPSAFDSGPSSSSA